MFEPRTSAQEYCRLLCFAAHRKRVPSPKVLKTRGKTWRELMHLPRRTNRLEH